MSPIAKTKELLGQAIRNPPWKRQVEAVEPSEAEAALESERYEAFIDQNLAYLASGDAILATEALGVLAAQVNCDWDQEQRRQYQVVLEEIGDALHGTEGLQVNLVERCRRLLLRTSHW